MKPKFLAASLTLLSLSACKSPLQNRDDSRPIQGSVEAAAATLGRTGGVLTIEAASDPARPGVARRTAILLASNGVGRRVALRDGGGAIGDSSIWLFALPGDRFRAVGPEDCIEIDPVEGRITTCPIRTTGCQPQAGETFIGRFDWMNGFDPPHAEFTLRFRYLPSYEMICGYLPAG